MIVDGRQMAEGIYEELAEARRGREIAPRLGLFVVSHDPVIESFVRIKSKAAARLGVEVVRVDLPDGADSQAAIAAVHELSGRVDGVIVQLPLPAQIDTDAVLASVPSQKDVDALNPTIPEYAKIVQAPVALAIEEILKHADVHIEGKRAIVVGAGRLVGTPVAAMLRRRGAHVEIVTLGEGSLDALKDADIIVSGAGSPHLITPDMIEDRVVLIDAGTSESGGKVVGDADPACAQKASVFTPVPGGVGPLAVAMIFKNLFELMRSK